MLEMVRASEPDAARETVLDAALSAFLDFGIRRTSMGEIAKRSGVSPATLYRRFADKRELVQAVALREARTFLAEVDSALDRGASAEEQVVELGVAAMRGVRGNDQLRRLLRTDPETILPLLTVDSEPLIDLGKAYLAGLLERLQAEGAVANFDTEPVAELFVRLGLSLAAAPATSLPVDDDAEARRFVREHMVAIIPGLPTVTA
jgi:AcrR family transcriptional regulator